MGELENAKILAAELAQDRPKLDLHGMFLVEGTLNEIDQFMYKCFNGGKSSAEIVYGIGEGKMQKFALDFLKKHPLVENIVEKQGYCIAILSEKI
jgi:dsDNA-specific endonuclease/ATPase MutS2